MSNDLRFLVKTETEKDSYGTYAGDTLRVTVHLIRMEDGHVRNISNHGYAMQPGDELADLEVSAILNQSSVKDGDTRLYGHEVKFDIYRIDARRARELVKVFARIETRMAKIESELGPAADFGEWLTRLGVVLKVRQYGIVSREGRGWSHDENEYRWMDASGIRYHLERVVREFAKTYSAEQAS